jgi:hypothetical protein
VFRRLYIALILILICPFTKAQTRWCTISHTGKIAYPPIGRAAHVSGVVIQRINFTTTGNILSLDQLVAKLLAVSTADQIKNWHLTTDAAGDEPCQSLVLVRYRIYNNDEPPPNESLPITPGMLQISVDSPVLVISDPVVTITRKHRFLLF